VYRLRVARLQAPAHESYTATQFHLAITRLRLAPASFIRLFKRFMLALLLVTAQHAAAMHALGHSMERNDDGQPAKALHAGCLGMHGIDDAPATNRPAGRTVPEFSEPCPDALPTRYSAPHQDCYHPRGPPANS
jgi:hypothetical protein